MTSLRLPTLLALAAALLCPTLSAGQAANKTADVTAPRLRAGAAIPQTPIAFGGGEVLLELSVGNNGAVTKVEPLRSSPPFTDAVTRAVGSWSFEPAQDTIDKQLVAVPGRVLVVALFRNPSVYAAPAPGAPTTVLGNPSPGLPQPASLAMPAYPPNVFGGATVLVEIEMTAAGVTREVRVLGSASGFDAAALAAVKSWRFGPPPRRPGTPDPLFVYALVSFREPVVTPGNGHQPFP